ncbi:MAG TPA: hypothetical protein VM144_13495 [Aestuariivirga sp.]|nr:hypothetical protein [Aestuariivirga sp.]
MFRERTHSDNLSVSTAAAPLRDDDLLPDKELAALLKINLRLPAHWRSNGSGPKFIRVGGRRVLYRWGDVKEYLASKTYSSTSEETTRAA